MSHLETYLMAMPNEPAERADRSVEDRLLCKQEVRGSNPLRSTLILRNNMPHSHFCSAWSS